MYIRFLAEMRVGACVLVHVRAWCPERCTALFISIIHEGEGTRSSTLGDRLAHA